MSFGITHCKLSDLLSVPPNAGMVAVVRRAGTLLAAVADPALRLVALEAGYAASDHVDGLFYYSFASRERSYGDWLDYEEIDPRCDPDNKTLLTQLEQLVDELVVRAAVGIATHVAPAVRDELLSAVCDERQKPTRLARAKTRLSQLRDLSQRPYEGASRADEHLRRGDGANKLALATGVLDMLRLELREAPIDPERRAYILSDVMKFERHLTSWLGAQHKKLALVASAEELEALGLGDAVPAPAPPLPQLQRFLTTAQA